MSRTILAIWVSCFIAISAYGDPHRTPHDCKALLESQPRDLSLAFKIAREGTPEAYLDSIKKFRLTGEDWESVLEIFERSSAGFIQKTLSVLPLTDSVKLNLVNRFRLFESEADFQKVIETIPKETLDADFAFRMLEQTWFFEGGYLEQLELSEEKKLNLLRKVAGAPSHPLYRKLDDAIWSLPELLGLETKESVLRGLEAILSAPEKGLMWIYLFFVHRGELSQTFMREALNHATAERRFAFLKRLASNLTLTYDRKDTLRVSYLSLFPELSRQEQLEILVQAHAHRMRYDWSVKTRPPSEDPYTRKLLDEIKQSERADYLVRLIELAPNKRFRHSRAERNQFLMKFLMKDHFVPLANDLQKVRDALGNRDRLHFLINASLEDVEHVDFWKLHVDEVGQFGLRDVFAEFSREHPEDPVSGMAPQVFWDRTTDIDTVRTLIAAYFEGRHLRETKSFDAKEFWRPRDSLELVAEIMGFDYEAAKGTQTQLSPHEFYSHVIAIRDIAGDQFFRDISISRDAFENHRKLSNLLYYLRNLLELKLEGWAWQDLVEKYDLKELRSDRLAALTQRAKEDFFRVSTETFNASLKAAGIELEEKINPEQFVQLRERWGDVEPLLTLASRYKAKEEWNALLGVLAEVVQHELNGTFEDWRYSDNAQVGMIAPDKLFEWTQNRYRIGAVDGRSWNQIQGELLANAEKVFLENDFQMLLDQIEWPYRELASDQIVEPLLEKILRSKPKEVLDVAMDSIPIEEHDGYLASLLAASFESLGESLHGTYRSSLDSHIEGLHGVARVEALSRLGQAVLARWEKFPEPEAKKLIRQKLKEIQRNVQYNIEQDAASGIVFSALSSGPKLMMSIGELIPNRSCTSYKEGSRVHGLMGYVIDGNVRAMVSYALNRSHFKSANDYKKVFRAIRTNQNYEFEWDEYQFKLHFDIEGERISTHSLGKIQLRNMIKLGRTDTGIPGVVAERGYEAPDHPALSAMKENHQALLYELAVALGGSMKERIEVSQSRSPLGQYSDLAGGVRTDSYSLRP